MRVLKTPPFPGFLGKSSRDYTPKIYHLPFPRKWEDACGPLMHSIGGGGGGLDPGHKVLRPVRIIFCPHLKILDPPPALESRLTFTVNFQHFIDILGFALFYFVLSAFLQQLRGLAMSLLNCGIGIGYGLAYSMGFLREMAGWRWTYWAASIPGVVVAAMLMLILPNPSKLIQVCHTPSSSPPPYHPLFPPILIILICKLISSLSF